MPPGRRHVFMSLASLHLHGDAKDAKRRTCRFPDVKEAESNLTGMFQEESERCTG